MKLVRFGAPGAEKPGLIDADGRLRDLSSVVADIDGKALAPDSLDRLRALDAAQLPAVPEGTRLGSCVTGVGNFIAVGLNYADHAAEMGNEVPAEPMPDTMLYALDVTPISAPYYAGTNGTRKLADVEAELAALQRLTAPTLVPILGFARVSRPTPDLPQATALCVVRGCANAWRMNQLLAQCRTLPWPSVRNHVQRLLDALHTLHAAGLVHRQVAPEHIVLEHDRVRLGGAGTPRRLLDLHRSNALNALPTHEAPAPDALHPDPLYAPAPSPVETANLFSRLTFQWMQPMMSLGARRFRLALDRLSIDAIDIPAQVSA